jgi:hypothetical protein
MSDIVLIKSKNCIHCQRFEPIYEKIQILGKKMPNVSFSSVEMTDENNVKQFNEKYKVKIEDMVNGVPSVYLINKKKFHSIEHTSIESNDPLNPSNEDIKKAAEKFLKSLPEDLKQEGGDNNKFYYEKYLKYKQKFLQLKNKNQI